MKIYNNYSLKKDNTFYLDVKARYFTSVRNIEDLQKVIKDERFKKTKKLIIGQGASVLFLKDFDGLVIKNQIKGIKIIKKTKDKAYVGVGGGENWHRFVMFAVNRNFGGIENLVMIPGSVGAAPVQNIAAYGQNISDVFYSLNAVNMETGKIEKFNKEDCHFSYRDSFFKSEKGKKYFVYKVIFELSLFPEINIGYFETGNTYTKKGSILDELQSFAKEPYTVKDVSRAVSRIRKKKLPDLKKVGSTGSFFKNPVVTRKKYEELLTNDPDLQCYPVNKLMYPKLNDLNLKNEDFVKIPGGRLLDNLGWKGKRIGNVGVHKNQAMAIVSYKGAKPKDIINLYRRMQKDVYKKFGIKLEPEVQFINF